MGASAAWHLSKAGASVTLIERAPPCVSTATAHSFGWVGASASTPSDDPTAFADRLRALQEFSRIERELGPLPIAARGALLWLDAEDETAAMIAEHQTAGTRMKRLARPQIIEKEPALAAPPPLAAWAPDDFAVEPSALARQLLAGAQALGATILRGSVNAIEATANRITGVLLGEKRLPADIVVLANGYGARALARTIDMDLPIRESPAVLIQFGAAVQSLRLLICTQGLELRPSLKSGLVSAADYPENGEAGLPALATTTGSAIAHLLGSATPPPLLSITSAQRPMTSDGKPLCGPMGHIEGLHALVAHPGVILAPLLGRLCAESVLSR